MAKVVMETKGQVNGQFAHVNNMPYETVFIDSDDKHGPHILLQGYVLRQRIQLSRTEIQALVEWAFTMGIKAEGA